MGVAKDIFIDTMLQAFCHRSTLSAVAAFLAAVVVDYTPERVDFYNGELLLARKLEAECIIPMNKADQGAIVDGR